MCVFFSWCLVSSFLPFSATQVSEIKFFLNYTKPSSNLVGVVVVVVVVVGGCDDGDDHDLDDGDGDTKVFSRFSICVGRAFFSPLPSSSSSSALGIWFL